ncbi:MAG: dTMP kinase [Chitinispirillaceae bacterium]
MSKGLFITFEGIDGCGKSTQLSRVADMLRGRGVTCVVTREPGGTPISEKIREILISPENSEMYSETELFLYLAARAQHVRQTIQPALKRGEVVLCDRFQEATFAYQGFGRGLDLDFLKNVNRFVTQGLDPDCTFIFDISVELSRERLGRMGKAQDRLEGAGDDFFSRIREGYRAAAKAHQEKIVLLDGSRVVESLTEEVCERICKFLDQGNGETGDPDRTRNGINIAT